MARYIQIITTIPNRKEGERIADALIKKRLAGCVQLSGPFKSTYLWKGKVNRAKEFLCFIKTKASLYKSVESEIRKINSHEVPEIIAFNIDEGYAPYTKWLESSMK